MIPRAPVSVRRRGRCTFAVPSLTFVLLGIAMLFGMDHILSMIHVTNNLLGGTNNGLMETAGDASLGAVSKSKNEGVMIQNRPSRGDSSQHRRPTINTQELQEPSQKQYTHYPHSVGPLTRQRRGLPPKILFHHAHKTGGTSACTMAQNNGEITPPNTATDILSDGPVCYYLNVPYCQKDLEELAQINSTVTYVDFHCSSRSSWWEFLNGHSHNNSNNANNDHKSSGRPRQWMFATFLRHPVERLLSEYRHYGFRRVFDANSTQNLTMAQKRNDKGLFMKYARDKNRANYYRRFYLPHCFGKSFSECANQTLRGYDILIILEDIQQDCPRLADALGWNANVTCSARRNVDSGRTTDALTYLGEERFKELLQLNALDVDIYNFARMLANMQRKSWRRIATDHSKKAATEVTAAILTTP
ncbi:sulfotransferase family protein [Nitzschia inconspicua]|uniref:Sulfotransferase family protein n=1 Tax=Nitzschia inconspicua TaxID=303405 RepID=A0A9K3KJ31_9STRA|nr:sulfotransferase family protein [Nitzschia inconspicua]KAG7370445.1 sulfotransferase family protein [Nitzschia inconspicua]